MFSGIVIDKGKITEISKQELFYKLTVQSDCFLNNVNIGDSIAINGVCLTAIHINNNLVSFELVSETIRSTTFKHKMKDDFVNIELSLKAGMPISGHFVFGHIDDTIKLIKSNFEGSAKKLVWSLPKTLKPYIAPKGSVAIDGVSLTIGEVVDNAFSVYIIPHTAEVTTLGDINIGETANIEVDMLARYVYNCYKNFAG